jgi:hypothetical protein
LQAGQFGSLKLFKRRGIDRDHPSAAAFAENMGGGFSALRSLGCDADARRLKYHFDF